MLTGTHFTDGEGEARGPWTDSPGLFPHQPGAVTMGVTPFLAAVLWDVTRYNSDPLALWPAPWPMGSARTQRAGAGPGRGGAAVWSLGAASPIRVRAQQLWQVGVGGGGSCSPKPDALHAL